MRQVFFVVAFLLSAAVPSLAQEQLKVGNTYSGNIKLSSPDNGVYLTLPEGQWVLASLEHTRNNPINTGDYVPIIQGRFVRTDAKNRITGVVSFESGNGSKGGWTTPTLCSRKDAFFVHAEVQNRGRREKTCWGVYPSAIGQPTANSSQYVRDFHQYAAAHKLLKPQSTITVHFYRSSLNKFLHALYFFNPEADGLPRSAMSTWQKDIVIADAKKVGYLNSKKAWGEQWLPAVEAAFNGRPR
jgi:hypothetical protein